MTTNYSEQKFDSKLELQNKLKEENLTMVVLSLNTIGENLNIVGDTGGKYLKMVGCSLNTVGDSLNMVRDSLNIVLDDKAPMPPNEQNRPKTEHIIPVQIESDKIETTDEALITENDAEEAESQKAAAKKDFEEKYVANDKNELPHDPGGDPEDSAHGQSSQILALMPSHAPKSRHGQSSQVLAPKPRIPVTEETSDNKTIPRGYSVCEMQSQRVDISLFHFQRGSIKSVQKGSIKPVHSGSTKAVQKGGIRSVQRISIRPVKKDSTKPAQVSSTKTASSGGRNSDINTI